MAAIGVRLIGPPHNGPPSKKDIIELEEILLEEGYKIEKLNRFNSFDIFLKLASGPQGDSVRGLRRETLERLEQKGYRDNTRHYEM